MKNNPFNCADDKDLYFMWEMLHTMTREQQYILVKFPEIMGQMQLLRLESHNLCDRLEALEELISDYNDYIKQFMENGE